MRNCRARSIWSERETLGSDSDWIRSSTIRRSTADCRVASSLLSDRASEIASARRGVSGNARRNASIVASGAAGSSMAASDRASAWTAFQRSS